jgi:hypothetical protein
MGKDIFLTLSVVCLAIRRRLVYEEKWRLSLRKSGLESGIINDGHSFLVSFKWLADRFFQSSDSEAVVE